MVRWLEINVSCRPGMHNFIVLIQTFNRWRFSVATGRRGFTLLELLIVLLIIGILSSVVVTRMGGNADNLRLKTDVLKVAAALRHARSKAVSENRTAQAVFQTEDSNLIITMVGGKEMDCFSSQTDALDRSPEILLTYQLHSGNLIKSQPHDDQEEKELEVFFYPNGSTSGSSLFLTNQEKSYQLLVNELTGVVQVNYKEL